MKPRVLIRTDGHYSVGMGHLVRCVALASVFQEKGCEVVFIVREYAVAKKMLKDRSFTYRLIKKNLNIEDEVRLVKKFVRRKKIDILIVDLRVTSAKYINAMKRIGVFVAHLDDFEKIKNNNADLIIAAESERRDSGGNVVRGVEYVILNKQFGLANRRNVTRDVKDLNNILLSFGGGDNAGIFSKVINALENAEYGKNVTLVLGATFKNSKLLKKIIDKTKLEIEIIKNTDDMCKLIKNADLAFLSGGVTKYEASCVGTPALIVAQEKTQFITAINFANKYKSTVCLGMANKLTIKMIIDMFKKVSKDMGWLKDMSMEGLKAVDGLGASRIAEMIEKLFLQRINI